MFFINIPVKELMVLVKPFCTYTKMVCFGLDTDCLIVEVEMLAQVDGMEPENETGLRGYY